MDRVYVRQKSISSTSGSSPSVSPMHRHLRTGSTGGPRFRRGQNNAAKAAAHRLAQVMAHQPNDDDDDDEDDDVTIDYSPSVSGSIGLRSGRSMVSPSPASSARSPSPKLGCNTVEQPSFVRPTSVGRPSVAVKSNILVPPSKPVLKPQVPTPPPELHTDNRPDKRLSVDLGGSNGQESGNQRSTSALQDEIDMLQEENESLLEKLRLAEERCEEAETRSSQLEKQVSALGEGVSLEARLLSRKEAALQQRETALKVAMQTNVKSEEVTTLRMEAESAKEEATCAHEQLQEAESEIKSLYAMSLRMILSEKEMEEVVLKRCWLARYWKLCVQHGIYADIAVAKLEYWSSLAPLPMEVVTSAGQKAREENSTEVKDKVPRDLNDLEGEGNIENMLLVEKGLRELASLKVEDAVVLSMGQLRRLNLDTKLPTEGQNLVETFELSQEESEDVLFKQAWLIYFWRRAKNHGLEPDIVDERLQFWIDHSTRTPTSHDAVDVDRGLHELRKLAIETQLWEASRQGIDDSMDAKTRADLDF